MRLFDRTAAICLSATLSAAFAWQGHALALTPKTASKGFGVYVNVQPAATIALSGTTFTWNSIKTTSQGYVLADNGPMTVTGGIRTSTNGGSSSIVIMSPADVQGTKKNGSLPINQFALTCAGNANQGTAPTYAHALTPLKANGTAPCASWGPGATTSLNFTLALYLQTQAVQKGEYASQGFSVIATAT